MFARHAALELNSDVMYYRGELKEDEFSNGFASFDRQRVAVQRVCSELDKTTREVETVAGSFSESKRPPLGSKDVPVYLQRAPSSSTASTTAAATSSVAGVARAGTSLSPAESLASSASASARGGNNGMRR
jgi:hypothetical protein